MESTTTTETNTTAAGARILGTTDDHSECCLCGRTNLRKVVVIELSDESISWFGTVCASKILQIEAAKVREIAKEADKDKVEARKAFLAPFEAAFSAMIVRAPSLSEVGFKARMEWVKKQPESIALQTARQR